MPHHPFCTFQHAASSFLLIPTCRASTQIPLNLRPPLRCTFSFHSAEVEKLAGELAAVRADFESMTSKYASAISRRKVWPPNSLTLPAGCVCGCEERSIGA
eukprot:365391-Chlamydomonas_euryale.AAC.16